MQRKLWSALEDSKSCSAEVLFPLVLLRTYEDVKEQRFLATFSLFQQQGKVSKDRTLQLDGLYLPTVFLSTTNTGAYILTQYSSLMELSAF